MPPSFNKTPKLAATPVPTITAVGVARPRAHGHAITSVEIPKLNANTNYDLCWLFSVFSNKSNLVYTIVNQTIQSIIAKSITIGTNHFATLSAIYWIGACFD